jgi:hypothetical protein
MTEVWASIPGEHYEASSCGRIRNARTGRVLKPMMMRNGYMRVQPGARRYRFVHRLVCAAFNGAPEGDLQVDHINKIRDDNRPENLRWVTPADNKKNRAFRYGENHPHSKLNAKQVSEIKALLSVKSNTEIGSLFGVARRTIADIRNGVTWK